MDVLRASSFAIVPSPYVNPKTPMNKTQFLTNPLTHQNLLFKPLVHKNTSKSKLFTALSSNPATTEEPKPPEPEVEVESGKEKFDWYSEWYPVMPVCDLDKRVPHAKKVLGLDLVVWWDRNENEWKVFDDSCPHRLAPLSEGRIDQWGRLQCVYHGWCFNGSGDCKLIPQAPPDGPPVHTFKKACVAAYPSTVQHDIVWFWPNTDPQYKDIIMKKKPPYIPVLDDPSFTKTIGNRDIPYGYDVLIENLMDPAHVPYAHYGLMRTRTPTVKVDREGGRPLDMSVKKLDVNGFFAKQEWGNSEFIAPCIFHAFTNPPVEQVDGTETSAETKKASPAANRRASLIFICVPVSPGHSRLIWTFPRNFAVWLDKIVPRWYFHIGQNLILDSDLYLLHVQERKIEDIGGSKNWQKACFVPTKSDALVVGFRRWLNKYSDGEVDWRGKFSGALPPSPPREQLLERYWSHVVNCKSCNTAHKGLNALEVVLQVISVGLIGIVAATKQNAMSMVARTTMVSMAIICFAASRWLAHFINKIFHYHDYNHALR
ncbi:Pheophorbide a oxygenase [Corchorus olitorius]|uniref:Pheophorbide a oxygenase n=1 Tax=Corchorus olitorius TaxID=93759 RepID=A0A1R3GIH7_9ROSI|nr:Pheophorbide a oxygenase [Corchorus olitorius]